MVLLVAVLVFVAATNVMTALVPFVEDARTEKFVIASMRLLIMIDEGWLGDLSMFKCRTGAWRKIFCWFFSSNESQALSSIAYSLPSLLLAVDWPLSDEAAAFWKYFWMPLERVLAKPRKSADLTLPFSLVLIGCSDAFDSSLQSFRLGLAQNWSSMERGVDRTAAARVRRPGEKKQIRCEAKSTIIKL